MGLLMSLFPIDYSANGSLNSALEIVIESPMEYNTQLNVPLAVLIKVGSYSAALVLASIFGLCINAKLNLESLPIEFVIVE